METRSVQQIYIGIFQDRDRTEKAYNSIYGKGYSIKNVNLIMSKNAREKYFTDDEIKNKRHQGLGSPISFVNGVIDLVKVGLVIPGYSVFVAGPISAGLSGAGVGGFSSGVIGSLLGIPEEHARKFESGINNGNIIMSLQPQTQEDAYFIEKIWLENITDSIYKK